MARDSEKRFHSIMEKLFHAPKSAPHSATYSTPGVQLSVGRKRPYQSTAIGVTQSNLRGNNAEEQMPLSASAGPQGPLCRPWDHDDFRRRLATFKSISWFAKPKVVSAVNCARRGWINVDIDTIACEVCGARLLFSTPASWNKQQVEKAALVFSLKLDNGHRLLCPWINNACDETLAQFPPTPAPILVDNFIERCSSLLQLSALPRTSSSTIEYMKSPLLEDFLEQLSLLECRYGSANNSEIANVGSQHEAKLYYQVLKLISLCGWKPRSLPYLVNCKYKSDQSVLNATILDSSQLVADTKSNTLIVHSADAAESLETDEIFKNSIGDQMDPNSVVLDCSLCGATVGLWTFCTIPRPVELFRFTGYTEMNVENDTGTHSSFSKSDLGSRQGITTMLDVATSSKDRCSSLNMTIAGGPPPREQNFKATISLPVIGQNLRARLSYDFDFRDHVYVKEDDIQSDSQNKTRFQEKTDYTANTAIGLVVSTPSETGEVSDFETASHRDSVVIGAVGSSQNAGQPTSHKDKMPMHTEADRPDSSAAADSSSSEKDLAEGKVLSVAQKTLGGQLSSLENYGVKDSAENPVNKEDAKGKYLGHVPSDKSMEFDLIRQHRHFCPWITSINNGEPGWQQTVSALYHHKNRLDSSPNRFPLSTSIVKVDDPVDSVRRLFMSPSTKRTKLTHFSGQSTEHR